MKIIKSDIFESPANIIMHCANCQCVMGAGIARTIRELYPEAYQADLQTKRGSREKLGDYSCATADDGVTIFNIYGQWGFGPTSDGRPPLEVPMLIGGMCKVKQKICENPQQFPAPNVGIPWGIGCGLAGGDWGELEPKIRQVWADADYPVNFYRL